jgi:PAS domain S-box-containing protein
MAGEVALNILMVEDDADTRENLRDILELDGHRIVAVATAAEALARDDWSFDTVLLDRRLPDGSAVDLLPALKRLAPAADVIILTGFADVEGAIAALRLGAADYLLKPINADELRTRVTRLAERRRAENELRRRSVILQSALKQVSDAAMVIDRGGKILLLSPAAERLIGPLREGDTIERDQWPGSAYRTDGATPYAWDELPLARALRGEVIIDEELYVRPPEDAPGRWMSANASPLRDQGSIQGGILILRDITERREAQSRALQAERLAAIGEMVTGLAHESRNALQRGQACLEMLVLEMPDRQRVKDLVARLQKALDDLKCLYEDVRDYAAPIQLRPRRSDLALVWRSVWKDLEPARKGRRAVLRETGRAAETFALVDPFRIGQVFRNLMENALAACPDPVEIAIGCTPDELDGHPALRISVRDDGPGLTPEQRQRVFQAFYTTKTKGTGLGLAICRRILEAHQGRISLGDDPGQGAEFILVLPRGNS